MKIPITASLLFPSMISAHIAWQPQITPPPEPSITPSQLLPSEQTPSITAVPSTHPPTASHVWDPIVSAVGDVLEEIDDHILHIDLIKRQGALGATNAVPATQPTQMPPVTVYQGRAGGAPKTYTQLFTSPLDQWPAPGAGTVGLGTIQGQVGVVKTNSKRAAEGWAEPTSTVSLGQIVRIKGREVTMS